jgi:hypothetical protein
MYDESKIEVNQLSTALQASLIENEKLTGMVNAQNEKLIKNEEDMQALFEASDIIEGDEKVLEARIREKELEIDNLQASVVLTS